MAAAKVELVAVHRTWAAGLQRVAAEGCMNNHHPVLAGSVVAVGTGRTGAAWAVAAVGLAASGAVEAVDLVSGSARYKNSLGTDCLVVAGQVQGYTNNRFDSVALGIRPKVDRVC